MTNTVVPTTLLGAGKDKNIVRRIHIISDGSEETDLVVYDNSTFIADVNKGKLDEITITGSDCICRLEWDATTDIAAVSVNPSSAGTNSFRDFGGLRNPGGSGATGDLLLSTAGLDNGDEVTLILKISQI